MFKRESAWVFRGHGCRLQTNWSPGQEAIAPQMQAHRWAFWGKMALTPLILPMGLVSAHGCLCSQVAMPLSSTWSTPTESWPPYIYLSVTSCPLPACSSLPHLKPDLIQLEPVHPSTPLTFHSHTWNPHTAFVWVSGVAALEPQLA